MTWWMIGLLAVAAVELGRIIAADRRADRTG